MRKTLFVISSLALFFLCTAFVSTNVPLDHFSYEAIDKLAGYGFIDSAMMTTRPLSRLEMARHIAEAVEKYQQLDEKNEIISAILNRLKAEFKDELITMGIVEGNPADSFLKPIEDPYIKYLFADEQFDLENQRGDVFNRHSNYRLGFASRMKLFDIAAFYFHPEYACSPSDPDDIDLVEAYSKLSFGKLEIEVGMDSLWWGPGYHGSMLISNNAEPFKMLKISNPRPIQLPWILGVLGPFKAVWFLAELENDRIIPKAKLTGLRLNFKPHPDFEFGLSRAVMFGGSGRPKVSLGDYFGMWSPGPEQPGTNQLAGFDVSVLVPLDDKIPVRSVKLYADFAGEDEAGGLPAKWGELFGAQFNDIFRTGRTDLRIECANNHVAGSPNVFYTHSLYQSGYTYKGRIIGHHMGTNSSDLFFRLTHYLKEDLILGLEFDREVIRLSSNTRQTTDQLGFDLTFFGSDNWRLITGYRYEHLKNSGTTQDNHIFLFQLVYDF